METYDMPLFQYECTDCSKECEILVRGQETPQCPACGSANLEKLASAFAPKMGSAAPQAPTACATCPGQGGGSCPYSS